MRFSDMMGSGEQRSRKASENDSAITDALAPYLDAVAPPEEPTPAPTSTESAAVEASTSTPATPSPEPAPPAAALRAHTVASVFPVTPVEPLPGTGRAEGPPASVREPIAVTELADFTPLSDDLLPRRR
jgi:hypothetical protein